MYVKSIIEGVPLEEFLTKSLVYNSNRDLINDPYFREKTGIRKLGTLTYHTKKLKINVESVYQYGIDNLLIPADIKFDDWYLSTRGIAYNKPYTPNITEKDILLEIANDIGLDCDDSFNEEIIRMSILDFITRKKLTKLREAKKKVMERRMSDRKRRRKKRNKEEEKNGR